jgi:hypothetical protein
VSGRVRQNRGVMRRHRPVADLAVTVAVAAACVALAGCTGSSAPPPPSRASAGAFPRAVPVIPGRVLAHSNADAEWRLWVASPDPLNGYRAARRLLVRAGFTLTKDREGTAGGDGQACTERLCVEISGLDDPVYGASVAYEVFRPSGVT